MSVFVEAADNEARPELAAELRIEGVAELNRPILVDIATQFLPGKTLDVGVREREAHYQLAASLSALVKDVDDGVHETREQVTSGTQHPCAFDPDRLDVRREAIRDGMKNQVEFAAAKHDKSSMKPFTVVTSSP